MYPKCILIHEIVRDTVQVLQYIQYIAMCLTDSACNTVLFTLAAVWAIQVYLLGQGMSSHSGRSNTERRMCWNGNGSGMCVLAVC